jgi:hypothetical protein
VGSDSNLPRGTRTSPGGHLDVQQSNIRAFAKDEIDRLLGEALHFVEIAGIEIADTPASDFSGADQFLDLDRASGTARPWTPPAP